LGAAASVALACGNPHLTHSITERPCAYCFGEVRVATAALLTFTAFWES
jgi:hypothetical protein